MNCGTQNCPYDAHIAVLAAERVRVPTVDSETRGPCFHIANQRKVSSLPFTQQHSL